MRIKKTSPRWSTVWLEFNWKHNCILLFKLFTSFAQLKMRWAFTSGISCQILILTRVFTPLKIVGSFVSHPGFVFLSTHHYRKWDKKSQGVWESVERSEFYIARLRQHQSGTRFYRDALVWPRVLSLIRIGLVLHKEMGWCNYYWDEYLGC